MTEPDNLTEIIAEHDHALDRLLAEINRDNDHLSKLLAELNSSEAIDRLLAEIRQAEHTIPPLITSEPKLGTKK